MTKGKGAQPGAGSLRKHVQRRVFRERVQPSNRKHLGPLEKHKDYVKRAKLRHTKVDKLQRIKRAAALKNKDEFNIGMTKSVMDATTGKMRQRKLRIKGAHRKHLEKIVQEDQSNANFLLQKSAADLRRARELQEDTIPLDAPPLNTHIIFADDIEEVRHFDPVKYFNTSKEFLAMPAIRPNLDRLATFVSPEALTEGNHALLSKAQKRQRRRVLLKYAAQQAHPEAAKGSEVITVGGSVDASPTNDVEGTNEPEEDVSAPQRDDPTRTDLLVQHKLNEITQRMNRSAHLRKLAKKVLKNKAGVQKSLNSKLENRFRRGIARRAR